MPKPRRRWLGILAMRSQHDQLWPRAHSAITHTGRALIGVQKKNTNSGSELERIDRSTMQDSRSTHLQSVLTFLAAVLIVKVTLNVLLGYHDYFPPNFESDFLRGRQSYFSGTYQWAFYAHIASGPVSLILGLILISEQFRIRLPKWHRSLGKAQSMIILFLLAPSGLWMSYHAATGTIAAIGFSALAIATGTCVLFGWQSAVKKRFAEHRRWMSRCFLLLCSAVTLRLIGGLITVTNVGGDWSYPLTAWASWLVPLAAFEFSSAMNRPVRRSAILGGRHSAPSAAALSLPAIEISARR